MYLGIDETDNIKEKGTKKNHKRVITKVKAYIEGWSPAVNE